MEFTLIRKVQRRCSIVSSSSSSRQLLLNSSFIPFTVGEYGNFIQNRAYDEECQITKARKSGTPKHKANICFVFEGSQKNIEDKRVRQ